jgi:hypothetical protein
LQHLEVSETVVPVKIQASHCHTKLLPYGQDDYSSAHPCIPRLWTFAAHLVSAIMLWSDGGHRFCVVSSLLLLGTDLSGTYGETSVHRNLVP